MTSSRKVSVAGCSRKNLLHWSQTILRDKERIIIKKRKMSKIMQKIVLFIEPSDDAWQTPLKIGNLFMNRFVVNEDAASEVVKIFELDKTSLKISRPKDLEHKNFEEERKQKGMDLIIEIDHLV